MVRLASVGVRELHNFHNFGAGLGAAFNSFDKRDGRNNIPVLLVLK
jgi:hypothetical protein